MELQDTLPRPKFRFTKENAREMVRRGWETRRLRAAKQKQDAENFRKLTPQSETLNEQLNKLADMIAKEKDIEKLSKLIAMQSRVFAAHQALVNPKGKRQRSNGTVPLAPLQPLQPLQ